MASNKKSTVSTILIIGVIILIVLLLFWQEIASFLGDTDVAADFISLTPFTNLLI